jgi:ketosteroid isomerase-like protein
MQSNAEILTAVYAAFNRRDIDGVFAYMHPDVDWPNAMEGGRVHGLDEVRAYWTRQWNLLNPRVDPVGIRDQEDRTTLVDVHQVVRDLAGKLLVDHMVKHIYSIQNGLIARMDIREVE